MIRRLLIAATLTVLALPAAAAETGLTLTLGAAGDFEGHTQIYDCGTETPLTVTYLNAAPNFLAIVPIEGEAEPLVFASVLSGSGARYAAGRWIWWTDGPEASLYDATLGEDAEPLSTCSEIVNTP